MLSATLTIYTGEVILFAILAIAMIGMAVYGLLIARKAAHSTAAMIVVMVGFAFLYVMLEAPFMGVVQVAVYTGAILMMFLFVLMMIGVDLSEDKRDSLIGQRVIAAIGSLGVIIISAGVVMAVRHPEAEGLKAANGDSNPSSVAKQIFGSHLLTMELVGAVLIVAALGAMALTHHEPLRKKITQEELVDAKMRAYAENGRHIGQKPRTGVYAESNSAANPALDPYGQPIEESVPRMLRVRGQQNTLEEISPITVARRTEGVLDSPVGKSTMVGMHGESAPVYPSQDVQTSEDSSTNKEETK
ncbi:MAG: NADH-quinone oxidoreductase subunit J [Actinomycetaceae bacterium]|nr:NADH-quinone oxidoreductase subunit J [Actinomycetaceae bacterium]